MVVDGKKYCPDCSSWVPVESFSKDKKNLDGLFTYCKSCCLERSRRYIQNNREKYYARMRRYQKEHAEAIRHSVRERQKRRIKSDPMFRLVKNLRNRFSTFFLKADPSRRHGVHTFDAVGIDLEGCMRHLEALFWPGMGRSNYGKKGWVVDHIVPLTIANREDPQWYKESFHYTNLQPLWYDDNSKKKNNVNWSPLESVHVIPDRLVRETKSYWAIVLHSHRLCIHHRNKLPN